MSESVAHTGSPSKELKHFTDRDDERAVFLRRLDAPASDRLPILMFYGVGGIGKSWLLQNLCQQIGDPPVVPSALLDFDPQSGGVAYHNDTAAALAEIQRQMDVECPRFQTAYYLMLHKQGVKDEPVRNLGDTSGGLWEFAGEFANAALSSIPGANLLVWFGKKVAGHVLAKDTPTGRWMDSEEGNADLLRLKGLTHQQILPSLPERLAHDLMVNLPKRAGKSCRGVIFLDTFEALRLGGLGGAQQHTYREEWIGDFYDALDGAGVSIVIAGRDQLTWDEVKRKWRDRSRLEQHRVGGLSETDARRFLEKCGVLPGALQDALLRISVDVESKPDARGGVGYHPFSLGLCADTVFTERRRNIEPDPESFKEMRPDDVDQLAQRFLRSLGSRAHETWVIRLAMTPRFDETAARTAFSRAAGAEQDAAWNTLLDYSFVTETADKGWWTLHARMKDALRKRRADDPEEAQEDHEFWSEHWLARSQSETDDLAALAWYHRYCLHPEAAYGEWNTLAEKARADLRMQDHYRLLDWWLPAEIESQTPRNAADASALNTLGVELREASLGNRNSNLVRSIACFRSAMQLWNEKNSPSEWAGTQNNLGNAYLNLPLGDRGENLSQSIACYQAALRVYTEAAFPYQWATTQNNLGIAYSELPLGDRGENLSQSIACYQAALRVRTEAAFPYQWAGTLINLGLAFEQRDDLPQAREAFTAAARGFRSVGDEEMAQRVEAHRDAR